MHSRDAGRYLWALAGAGEMPMLGDDDGGRLFHPFGDRSRFARATLAACSAFLAVFKEYNPCHGPSAERGELAAWWLGDRAEVPLAPRVSASFLDTGVVTMVEGDTEIIA